MGRTQGAEAYFRKQLRRERERRGWSQAHLTKLLSDNGLATYPNLVAKIEGGDRPARVDEVAAVADLFDVSMDVLLGRSVTPKDDLIYVLRGLSHTAQQASWQIESLETTLRDGAAEVIALAPGKSMANTFASGCERAADALAQAHEALRKVMNPPGRAAVQKALRAIVFDDLEKEGK
jgi:transcriptional regulator with XRE-family HTH domain